MISFYHLVSLVQKFDKEVGKGTLSMQILQQKRSIVKLQSSIVSLLLGSCLLSYD